MPACGQAVDVVYATRRSSGVAPRACVYCGRRIWPLHDIALAYIVWCLAHKRGVGGGIHCGILFLGKLQGGKIKNVFRANSTRID